MDVQHYCSQHQYAEHLEVYELTMFLLLVNYCRIVLGLDQLVLRMEPKLSHLYKNIIARN